MKVVIGLFLAVICALAACTPSKPVTDSAEMPRTDAGPLSEVEFGKPCTIEQAKGWRKRAETDPQAALQGAACLVFLAEQEPEGSDRLALAKNGRSLAAMAVKSWPDSGLAHYLLAYLTGLVAEGTPLRGLELVKIIEREAQLAAELQPDLDRAGPYRMLGELYLRAPGFPVSIGDPALAIEHFRQAVALAPTFVDNRLGLVEALLTEGENRAACNELNRLFQDLFHENDGSKAKEQALDLQQRLCDQLETR